MYAKPTWNSTQCITRVGNITIVTEYCEDVTWGEGRTRRHFPESKQVYYKSKIVDTNYIITHSVRGHWKLKIVHQLICSRFKTCDECNNKFSCITDFEYYDRQVKYNRKKNKYNAKNAQ